MEAADFSGYATKAGLKCSDGRTITAEAFKHMDGQQVPLVWQHGHDKPELVLGHAILEARSDGMYVQGFFNDTPSGKNSKLLVQHKDINALSIYANQLMEKGKSVLHGVITEVSLVLKGANPGALIDQVRIAHSDGDVETLEDEAIIFTGLEFEHADTQIVEKTEVKPPVEDAIEHVDANGDETIGDIIDSMDEKQKNVMDMLIESAVEDALAEVSKDGALAQSATNDDTSTTGDTDKTTEDDLTHTEGNENMTNVFETANKDKNKAPEHTLSHSDLRGIVEDGVKQGSLKAAFESYAIQHSIEDIDIMFPDAKFVTSGPELIARRTEWVASILNGAKHSPFSRIKSWAADLTADEARAKGYVKGNLKKEEIIKLLKRVTTPTTIYKKQKLDRDDIIDITDIDVVVWLKGEMRLMLEEELARAILVGDGREPDDEDKIDEDMLRPIAWDDEMYAHSITVPANTLPDGIVETILRARKYYKGTGTPTLYTTDDVLTDLILIKDRVGRRLYNTEQELAAALRVSNIVVVEVMEGFPDLLAIIVNIADYTIGADRGGAVSMFDDFDIDYNQYKYLIETRASGALTKPKSAVVVKRTSGTVVSPQTPTYNTTTHVLTIPTQTGVTFYDSTDTTGPDVVLTAGTHTLTRTTDVTAKPNANYSFPHNTDADWTYPFA